MSTWNGVIAVEGATIADGRLISPSALTWKTPVPFAHWTKPIGYVDTIWRDGFLIRATGVLDEKIDLDGLSLTIAVGNAKILEGIDGKMLFVDAQIETVHLIPTATWPECYITIVETGA